MNFGCNKNMVPRLPTAYEASYSEASRIYYMLGIILSQFLLAAANVDLDLMWLQHMHVHS